MLSSIHPLGERGRSNRWGVTVTAHVIGAVAGGALVGLLLGSVGWVLDDVGLDPTLRAAVLVPLAIVAAVVDARGWPRWLPRTRRQVDERWLHAFRGWVYGIGFGVQLGMGVSTIITAATVYVIGALAVVVGSPLAGLALGGAFGLARGLTILAGRSIQSPERLVEFHRGLVARRNLGVSAAVAADVVLAVGAVTVVAGSGMS
jgi:hypothetical protein